MIVTNSNRAYRVGAWRSLTAKFDPDTPQANRQLLRRPKERSDQRAVREAIEGWEEDSRKHDWRTENALRENLEVVQSSVDVWGFTEEKILRRVLNLMEVDVMGAST